MALSQEEIVKFLDDFEKDSKAIKDEALRMCWHMRGSLSYDDAMLLCYQDKEIISKIIKDNLETTKKTRLPFF